MTHAGQFWDMIRRTLRRGHPISLLSIYEAVEMGIALDAEDQLPEAPHSHAPKWKRNVRNVLQRKRGTAEVEWLGNSQYQLP
jgi:hypothetical protein